VLIGCLWSLGEKRIALGVAGAVALLSAAIPIVFAPIAIVVVVIGPYLGPIAILAVALRTTIVARRVREPAERRAAFTACARDALWLGLVLLLPASAIFAYLRGASIFCF
jgi:hypothetical protein